MKIILFDFEWKEIVDCRGVGRAAYRVNAESTVTFWKKQSIKVSYREVNRKSIITAEVVHQMTRVTKTSLRQCRRRCH
jgi:hypothetical protein